MTVANDIVRVIRMRSDLIQEAAAQVFRGLQPPGFLGAGGCPKQLGRFLGAALSNQGFIEGFLEAKASLDLPAGLPDWPGFHLTA